MGHDNIIRQCRKQKVAVFFKQWGGIRPKAGGRTINGKEYSQYPSITRNNNMKDIKINPEKFR